MFNIVLLFIKIIFVLIMYIFIFAIVKLMHRGTEPTGVEEGDKTASAYPYLKLINRYDVMQFGIKDSYNLVGDVLIGRHRDNHIAMEDPFVSEIHAQITVEGDTIYITDLGSKNGTFVNRERIEKKQKVLLKNGDRIKIGQSKFFLEGHE